MVLNADAYRAHLDAHPVAADDAIGLIRRDLAYDGPGAPSDSDHDQAFYQQVLAQYDALAAQLARYQDAIPHDLAALHPKFTDSDHCRTCGDVYPCPTLTSAAHHGLNTDPR